MATIYLDFGHGGSDSGAVGNGFKEKDLTLKIGLKIESRLKEHGFAVVTSRKDDSYVGNASDRGKLIAKSRADYGLSLHLNSSTNSTARGGEIFVPCGESYGLVEYIMAQELEKLNKFRGIKSRELSDSKGNPTYNRTIASNGVISNVKNVSDYYGVIRGAWSGGVSTSIVELVFISNSEDMSVFIDKFDKYVEAIVKAICGGFKVPYKEPEQKHVTQAPTSTKKTMYRVSVASYEKKENAEKLKQELIDNGYKDTFISVVEL